MFMHPKFRCDSDIPVFRLSLCTSSINDTRKHKCDAPYFQIVSLVDYLHPILNQLQITNATLAIFKALVLKIHSIFTRNKQKKDIVTT